MKLPKLTVNYELFTTNFMLCFLKFNTNRVVSPLPICVHIPCFLPSPKVKFTLK